jgi:hypothetical protein
MTDPATQRVPQTTATSQNIPTQNASGDVPLRSAVAKDLSLVSLVPKWSGGETALPIKEFFLKL